MELDLYLSDSGGYVVEVKSHAKSGDVMPLLQKELFAQKKIGEPLGAVIIASSAGRVARKKCKKVVSTAARFP